MAYLHILGAGKTQSEIANSKGHLFEKLMCDVLTHLKCEITRTNRSKNGLEIDIEGRSILGNLPFFAECKAHQDPLDSTAVQQFGFKFQNQAYDHPDARGYLFSLSSLNSSAQEVWDDQLKARHQSKLECYFAQDIIQLIIEHYHIVSETEIRQYSTETYKRVCGDSLLLCMEVQEKPQLFWAQLLLSSDGAEPRYVVFFTDQGSEVTSKTTVETLQQRKHELGSGIIECLNFRETEIDRATLDDLSPARRVVRVRMSSDWFDYRFPAAPEFFVGRDSHRRELASFVDEISGKHTSTRGFLISGKSGIGKSSLALKAREELRHKNVVLLPIDSRLCEDVTFVFDSVNELLFELRQIPNMRTSLNSVQIWGVDSLIETLQQISDVLTQHNYLAVLFFDQFERVFEYPAVTRLIRGLFLNATERGLAVLFGFAWKSDLWSLAEGFPHSERADIVSESYALDHLSSFGDQETSEILKQLDNLWEGNIGEALKKQLRIFSRGLPWLLKKVCAHVLEQQRQGTSENELIETNLKLQDLFEADLAGLDVEDLSLLRAIAPLLPATLRRLSESFEISNIDQSLHRFIDQRILVKITEDIAGNAANVKYDAYSDIFREFLITGVVPIEDAYYFATYPNSAMSLFNRVKENGTWSIEQESEETGKIAASIYNLSRDLRNLGLLRVRNRVFTIGDDVKELKQEEITPFLQGQLKRNRVVRLILAELNEHDSMSIDDISILLQQLFPSVEAKKSTWMFYGQTTAAWLHEAQLAYKRKKESVLYQVDDETVFERIIDRGILHKGYRFPMCFRNAIIDCLEKIHKSDGEATADYLATELMKSNQSVDKALSDCLRLGFVVGQSEKYELTALGKEFVSKSAEDRRIMFGQQCHNFDVFQSFLNIVEQAGFDGVSSSDAAKEIVMGLGLEMADLTTQKLGGILANWAEFADLVVRSNRLCYLKEYFPQQSLF